MAVDIAVWTKFEKPNTILSCGLPMTAAKGLGCLMVNFFTIRRMTIASVS